MIIGVTVINEDNVESNITVNVAQIVTCEMVNPRNINAGTLIYLTDSRVHESRISLDIIQVRIDKAIERFGNQILVSYLAEQMPQPKKRATKKTTTKTVKY